MATAKEKTFKTLADNGWVLDPAETVKKITVRGIWKTDEESVLVQNPKAFVKPAADGGTWHVELDYTNSSGWTDGDILQYVTIAYKDADGQGVDLGLGGSYPSYRRGSGNLTKLVNSDRGSRNPTSYLWEALKWHAGKTKDELGSLRGAADLLFKDPETAVWLAIQAKYEADVAHWLQAEKEWAIAVAKARPLPVTVTTTGSRWSGDNEWLNIVAKLTKAANRIARADGTSDLPQLIAEAHVALNNIVKVLTPEARTAMYAAMDEGYAAAQDDEQELIFV